MNRKVLFSRCLKSMTLALLFTLACNVPPPSFVELSAPRGSIDALGPYAFSARVNGVVDEVHVFWLAVTPESENQRPTLSDFESANRLILSLDNGLWRGELVGGLRVAQYYFYFEAIGPGGRSQEPRGGVDRFEVNALTTGCVVDGDCLSGELCHRQELYCFNPPSPCTEDVHCPRDRVCNVESGLCRFTDRVCEVDTDCTQGQNCVSGQCQDVIEPPPPPPPPPECDPVCLEGTRCVDGMCISEDIACTADGQCGEGFACDLRTGLCQAGIRGHHCEPCSFDGNEGEDSCGVGYACRAFLGGCRPLCGSRGPQFPECDESEACVDAVCLSQNQLASSSGICGALQCINHEECESGRCDRGRCTEVQFCDVDSDCSDQVCDAGVCRSVNTCDILSCGQDALCLNGQCQVLNEAPSNCFICESDFDCGNLSHCLPDQANNQGRCFSLCEIDEHCEANERCYIQGVSVGYCAPNDGFSCGAEIEDCNGDEFEPNDDLTDATVIQVVPMQQQSFEGSFCPLDSDFYRLQTGLQTDEDTRYTVQILTQIPSEYYLYNEVGEEIAYYPNFFPIAEGISFELIGTHYLEVVGIDGVDTGTYQVNISAQTMMIECNDDDNLEENDTIDQSYPIGSGAELTLSLCPADADWFVLRGREGELWSISLFLRAFDGEVEMSVGLQQQYETGTALEWFYDGEGQQTAEFTIQSAEPYYLSLRCYDCTESVRYLLGLSR